MTERIRKYIPSQIIPFNAPRGMTMPRVPLFAPSGAGKTAFAGGWILAEQDKANYGKDFFTDVDEGGSDIRLAVDNLKIGRFPEKTPKDELFEAITYFKWRELGGLRWVEVCAPVIDPSGENVREIIDFYNNRMYTPNPKVAKELNWLHKYILDCDAAILILDATKAKGVFEKGLSIDVSYKGNPDTEAARVLEAMMNYKAQNKGSRKLRGALVAITKVDAIKDYLPPKMNLETDDGIREFLARCFNHTYSKLMYRRIAFDALPFWFDVKEEDDKPVVWEDDGKPMIAMDEATGRPHYSYGSFDRATQWLKRIVG